MEFTKLLKDYIKTPLEEGLNDFLNQKLTSVTCYEKIKNKDYMIRQLKPCHEFIISTTELPKINILTVKFY